MAFPAGLMIAAPQAHRITAFSSLEILEHIADGSAWLVTLISAAVLRKTPAAAVAPR